MKKYVLFLVLAFFGLQGDQLPFGAILKSIKNDTDKDMKIILITELPKEGQFKSETTSYELPAGKETQINKFLKRQYLTDAAVTIRITPPYVKVPGGELRSFAVHMGKDRHKKNVIFTSAFYNPIQLAGGLINQVSKLYVARAQIMNISIVLKPSAKKLLPITAILQKVK